MLNRDLARSLSLSYLQDLRSFRMLWLWRSSSLTRLLYLAAFLTVCSIAFYTFSLSSLYTGRSNVPLKYGVGVPVSNDNKGSWHPIDDLIANANAEWSALLKKETKTAKVAAKEYRRRRGRHPPPGFAEWFEFAQSKDAVVVEDFFDQIYHDLSPFWGLEPKELRRQARSFEPRIRVRNRTADAVVGGGSIWLDAWLDLVRSVEGYLPDLDMPFNSMDESRIVAPWETISEYVEKERSSRHKMMDSNPKRLRTQYIALSDEEQFEPFMPRYYGPADGPFWDMARVGCPPESPARNGSRITDTNLALSMGMDNFMQQSENGYVGNWTQAKDVCFRPELQALFGTFIEPLSVSTTRELFPLFGGSKLGVNNEILIPPAMYWAENEWYSGGDVHGGEWELKKDVLAWRGSATGGRNRPKNWTGFQRHRLLAMLNATSVASAEQNSARFLNFILPSYDYYNLTSGLEGHLPDFLNEHVDSGFVHLICFPCDEEGGPCEFDGADPHCTYTDPYFAVTPGMPMGEQYANKYLPDIDGNSFSGRYRGFLLSTSLPIKSTIYNEWHDSRLIPWAHFVPMDSTYLDMYGIMEYFIGYTNGTGHDEVARKIALDGKAWAEKVLRHEDMQIYTYRLLLEYARISDDNRDFLGVAEDLL